MQYQIRRNCLCCKNKNIKKIFDLGFHSFADRFVSKSQLGSKDPVYPLIIDMCQKCGFIQSRIITNPEDRYSKVDYSYTSSNSDYAKNHWNKLAKFINQKFKVKNKKIVEIGSNDGFLLKNLQNYGAKVLGIDASKFMVKKSKKYIDVMNCIFTYNESKKIKQTNGKSNIVIANNVFNHSNDPGDFVKGVKNILLPDGVFIFEQPYFVKTLKSLKFDQIYHEHISYFTSKNIDSILKKNDFKIIAQFFNHYHGGSIRTISAINTSNYTKFNIKNLTKIEKNKEVYKVKTYKKILTKIELKRKKLFNKILLLKKKGYTIVGIGAAAKSNTFLTYYKLDQKVLDFITDASKYKIGKYTPLTRIPIKHDNELKKYKKIACLILTWNLKKLIIKKMKKINKNILIIKN